MTPATHPHPAGSGPGGRSPSPMIFDEFPPFAAHPIDATTVAVSGEIDVYAAPDLAAVLAGPTVERIIMNAVTFIDAAGLNVLLEAHRSRPQGLILCSPSRCVLRLLDLTGHCSTFRLTTGCTPLTRHSPKIVAWRVLDVARHHP